MWSLRVTSLAQRARRRSGWRAARGFDKKCQKTENNVYSWQCTIRRFTVMHYTVRSWNKLLGANTNKLKSSNSLCYRAKSKHLEADSATGSWTCDNWIPVVLLDEDMVIRDPVNEVQFRDEEANTRIVLNAWHAGRNDSVMHSDTLTMTLMFLSYCLVIAKTSFWNGATRKRGEAWTFYATRPRQC